MTHHSSGTLSHQQYINGLRDADPSVLISVYTEFRAAVVRAVTMLGGSEADGGIFFRAGLVEAARQVRAGEFAENEPFFFQIRELALAHYRDWLAERLSDERILVKKPPIAFADTEEQETDFQQGEFEQNEEPQVISNPETPSTETQEEPAQHPQATGFLIPTPETLRLTRQSIYAWRYFERLNPSEQRDVFSSIETGEDSLALQQYCSLLKITPAENTGLPQWVLHALRDTEGYHFWQKTQDLERKIAAREPLVSPPADSSNKWVSRIILMLIVLVGIYWAYNYLFRAAAPREVYQENFQPPASILDDLDNRKAADTMSLAPLPDRPVACEDMLRQADANYREKDYSSAAEILYRIAEDESLSSCHADAWFYLGIVGLQLDDPGTTLQCFAKIDNLDRFGEDIYWYQALAFVKLAEGQPQLRDKAERAVERAMGATSQPDRQAKAQEMLDQLRGKALK